MYIAIAVVLYLGFAVLVGRFCSLNSKWERAVGNLPDAGGVGLGREGTEGTPFPVEGARSGLEPEPADQAAPDAVREETPVGAGT